MKISLSFIFLGLNLLANAQSSAADFAGDYIVQSCKGDSLTLSLPRESDGITGEVGEAIGHAAEGTLVSLIKDREGLILAYEGQRALLKPGRTQLSDRVVGVFNHVVVKESVHRGIFGQSFDVTLKSTIQSFLWPSPRAKASWSFRRLKDATLSVNYAYRSGAEHYSQNCHLIKQTD